MANSMIQISISILVFPTLPRALRATNPTDEPIDPGCRASISDAVVADIGDGWMTSNHSRDGKSRTPFNGLHLRETSVHKQFCSCDEACVIGGKKHDRLGDLIGRAQPAERNIVGDIL